MKYIIFISFLFYISCKNYGHIEGQAKFTSFLVHDYNRDSILNQQFAVQDHAWFYDGNVIIEKISIHQRIDTNKVLTQNVSVDYYYFYKESTKTMYKFSKFEKDCNFSEKVYVGDTVSLEIANFFLIYKSKYHDKITYITDTFIRNQKFKYFEANYFEDSSNKSLVRYRLFGKDENKDLPIHLNKKFDIDYKTNLAIIECEFTKLKNVFSHSRLDFVRKNLTKSEKEVFKSWNNKCN